MQSQRSVKAIRIIDPYIVRLVIEEQSRSGEATTARTAARLISERIAQREVRMAEPLDARAFGTARYCG